jgi:hypothetical protein
MKNRDEDLTLENVDERIEQLLRGEHPAGASAPLAHAVRDLQRVYDEEHRLEHAWELISSRAQSLESIIQGEQKIMQDTSSSKKPGSFQSIPDGPLQEKRSPRRRRWLSLGLSLAAAIVLIAVFAWLIVPVFHGTQTGSGGPTPTVVPGVTPTVVPGVTPTVAPGVTPTVVPGVTPTVAR